MAKKPSKRYQKAAELLPEEGQQMAITEAVTLLKKMPPPKFDQTVGLAMHTSADPRRSDQMVRGTCSLPHGTGQTIRVLVFAEGDAAEEAKNAGADFVGYEDLIKKITDGWMDFDVAVATPAAMSEVRKLGRQLGPRGLMPNPKTGTVTDDVASAIQECKAGRVEFKLDRASNIAVAVGKLSFDDEKIIENAEAVINAIVRAKAPGIKGRYLNSLSLTATMSPSIKLDPAAYLK
jgi:large subunit ribosomal protein L1